MVGKNLRILFVYRSDVDVNGGAAGVMNKTCEALRKLGVQVEITHEMYPETSGFDAVHAFNIWSPPTALAQLKHFRQSGVPVIWSPFYLDWCEYAWANLAFELIYRREHSQEERAKIFNAFTTGALEINGLAQWKQNEVFPGFHRILKEMLSSVDYLCVTSHREIQKLVQITGRNSIPFAVTPHGVEAKPFASASPLPFASKYGVRDFVLCVGAVESRKNQLMLIEALKGTALPIVLIGPAFEPPYLEACLKSGGQMVLHTGKLGPDMVASAYRAASVHALPSYAEGAALANLEAAVSRCAMVVSNRSSEFEYFGDGPFFCSPNDPSSIREAVRLGMESSRKENERWEALGRKIEEKYTWERTAELTLEVYERVLTKKLTRPAGLSHPVAPRSAGPQGNRFEGKIPVVWSGPVFNRSGTADQARNFIRRMRESWPLFVRPAGKYDESFVSGIDPDEVRKLASQVKLPDSPYISILSGPAYSFERDPGAVYNIGKTTFETDGLSAEWVSKCNLMDEIWVPTEFNAETFRRSGVKVPLFVIPEGVDPDFYRPGLQPLSIPGLKGFTFLSVFEWTFRKGWDLLLKAWADAFSAADDVRLLLLTHPEEGTNTNIQALMEEYLNSIGRSLRDVAPISIIRDQIPQSQMPHLYATADAFVLPSRGEGWGRPYIEAMSCSLPVIGTGWSGNLAFMNEENSYLIQTNGLEAVDGRMELPFYRGQHWSSPSPDHLPRLLRYVFTHRDEAGEKGQRARRDIAARWSWDKSTAQALSRIRTVCSELEGKSERKTSIERAVQGNGNVRCLRWEGLQFAWHSMALINRELCLRLIDAGHELSILRYLPEEFGVEKDPRFKKLAARVRAPLSRPAEIHVRHHFPPDFNPPPEGRWIMIQPWEYGRIPQEWVEPMSRLVDEIWVPSRYVMKSYIASGIPSDIVRVVPNGVNTGIFNPEAKPFALPTEKKFKFLFVGGIIWRKGLDVLLQAYRQAFSSSDDVSLVIKEIGNSNFYKGMGSPEIIREIQQDQSAPEIIHLGEMFSEEQMAGLYTACDCLVHSYRGEGFALPVLEAMACGLPVAVTEGGATDDFCRQDTAFLIPAEHKGFYHNEIKFAGGPGWVLEPNPQALAELLRHIRNSADETALKAERGLELARTKFAWDNVFECVQERLAALIKKPVRRMHSLKV